MAESLDALPIRDNAPTRPKPLSTLGSAILPPIDTPVAQASNKIQTSPAHENSKQLELQPEFALGTQNHVDAKDRRGFWYTAKIVAREHGELFIHFDGWDPKEDIRIPEGDDTRIRPFRTVTRGSTFPKKTPHRLPNLITQNVVPFHEKITQQIAGLEQLLRQGDENTSGLQNYWNPRRVICFLRGTLFFYSDAFFHSNAGLIQYFRKKRAMVQSFLDNLFDLIIAWMRVVSKRGLLQKYLPLLSQDKKQVQYQSFEAAIACSSFQIATLIRILCGNYEQRFRLAREAEVQLVYMPDAVPQLLQRYEIIHQGLFEQFYKVHGGLEATWELCSGAVPLEAMLYFLAPLLDVGPFLLREPKREIAGQAIKLIEKRLEILGEADLEQLQGKTEGELHYALEQFSRLRGDTVDMAVEMGLNVRMRIALMFVKQGHFSSKLKGLKLLQQAISRATTQSAFVQLLLRFIKSEKILELVLGKSMHPEIIKRTQFLFQFLLTFETDKQSLLDTAFIDSVWTAFQLNAQNEDFSLSHILVKIVKLANLPLTDYIIQKLVDNLGKFQNFSLLSVFIKDLLKALDENYLYRDQEERKAEHIQKLIELLENLSQRAPPDAQPLIEVNMGDAMRNIPSSSKNFRIQEMIDKLRTIEGVTVIRTLNLWLKPSQQEDQVLLDQDALYRVKPKFHNLLLDLLESYLKEVRLGVRGFEFTDLHLRKEFRPGCPHGDTIESFFQIIEKIVLFADKSKIDFSGNHFQRLFTLTVVQGPTFCEQERCLRLVTDLMIAQDKRLDKAKNWLLPSRFRRLFKTLKSAKPPLFKFSAAATKVLLQIFLWVNSQRQILILVSLDGLLFKTLCSSLDCLPALWKVSLCLEDADQRRQVHDIICSIYLWTDFIGEGKISDEFKVLKFQKDFLRRCLNFKGLTKQQTLHQLDLLVHMLRRFQGFDTKAIDQQSKGMMRVQVKLVIPEGDVQYNEKTSYMQESAPMHDAIGFRTKTYEETKINKTHTASIQYEVPADCTVGMLRRRISQRLDGVQFQDIKIQSERGTRFLQDYQYLSSVERVGVSINAFILSSYQKNFTMEKLLQNEPKLRRTLLRLLASPQHAVSMRAWEVLEKLTNNDYERQRCWVHGLKAFDKKKRPQLPPEAPPMPPHQAQRDVRANTYEEQNLRSMPPYKPDLKLMMQWEKVLLYGVPVKPKKPGETELRVMLYYLKFLLESIGADPEEQVELFDRKLDLQMQRSRTRAQSLAKSQIRALQPPKQSQQLQLFAEKRGMEFLIDLVFMHSKGDPENPMRYMMLKNIFVLLRHYLLHKQANSDNLLFRPRYAQILAATLVKIINSFVHLMLLQQRGMSMSMLQYTPVELGLHNFFALAFYLLFKLSERSSEAFEELQYAVQQNLLFGGLENENEFLRNDTIKAVKVVATHFREDMVIKQTLTAQFVTKLMTERDPLYHLKDTSTIQVAAFLIQDDVIQISPATATELANSLVTESLALAPTSAQENSDQDARDLGNREQRLHACAILLEIIFKQFGTEVRFEKLQNLLEFYLEQALLKEGAPLCRSLEARAQIQNTLLELVRLDRRHGFLAVRKISRFHFEQGSALKWRTHSISDWNISSTEKTETRGKGRYSGLRNLGCTCYMNSLLQQYFMLKPFRDAILSLEDQRDNVEPGDNLLTQLKRLYIELQHTQSLWCDTLDFAKSLKDLEGQGGKIDIAVQKDASEFQIMFIDQLEEFYRGTDEGRLIEDLLKIRAQDELTCQECKSKKKNEHVLFPLSCRVANMSNLQKSIADLVKGETLDGDNKLECQVCEKKTAFVKRLTLKYLPNVLAISLNRFGFDFDKGTRYKLNERFEFKRELDMRSYTSEHIQSKEIQELLDNGEKEMQDLTPDQKQSLELNLPEQYYRYQLAGVVVHEGSADQGHYFSYIDAGEQWYEFNDKFVRKFDHNRLEEQTFGGHSFDIGGKSYEKSRNAYILIYKRVVEIDRDRFLRRLADLNAPASARRFRQDSLSINLPQIMAAISPRIPEPKSSVKSTVPPLRVGDISSSFRKEEAKKERLLMHARKQNKKFWERQFIFTGEYQTFVAELLDLVSENVDPRLTSLDQSSLVINHPEQLTPPGIAKLAIAFYLTIVIRSRDWKGAGTLHKLIKLSLASSQRLSEWLLSEFSRLFMLDEFLVYNRKPLARIAVQGLIKTAWNTLRASHNQICDKFLSSLLFLIFETKTIDGAVMPQGLYSMLFKLIRIDPGVRERVMEHKGFQWLLFLLMLYFNRAAAIGSGSSISYSSRTPTREFGALLKEFLRNREPMDPGKLQKQLNVVQSGKSESLLSMKNLRPLMGNALSDVYSADIVFSGTRYVAACLSSLGRAHHYSATKTNFSLKPTLRNVDTTALHFFQDLETDSHGIALQMFNLSQRSKLAACEVGKLWAHLCTDQKEMSRRIIKLLNSRRASSIYNIQGVLHLLQYQLQIKDSLVEYRFDLISDLLCQIFRGRQEHFGKTSSYSEMLFTSLFIQKNYLGNEQFRMLCIQNGSFIRHMDEFLHTYAHPPSDSNCGRAAATAQKFQQNERELIYKQVEILKEISQIREAQQIEQVYLSKDNQFVDELEVQLDELPANAELESAYFMNEKSHEWVDVMIANNYGDFVTILIEQQPSRDKRRGTIVAPMKQKEVHVSIDWEGLVLGEVDEKVSWLLAENVMSRGGKVKLR